MSAPNLNWWLPLIFVQLLTTWNCCSLSVSGQLQRPTFKPSPKPEFEPFAKPFPPKKNEDKPVVSGVPWFNPGIPNPFIGVLPASEYAVCGLYLKYPKRRSVNSVAPSALSKPVAKL